MDGNNIDPNTEGKSLLYQYLPKDEIRLLEFELGDNSGPMLRLNSYPRSSVPEYDAVTYAWGEDISEAQIICNNVLLDIRAHLCRALPLIHQSRPNPKRPLWIDAICLNQKDAREKELHVPLMGRVYENAARTLVWLGESADDSDLAMDRMYELTQAMLGVEDPGQILYSLSHSEDIAKYNLPSISDPIWQAVRSIQLRSWFFRLWTLQEIVLSKNPLLICGTKFISWDALFELQQAAGKAYLGTLSLPPVKFNASGRSCASFLRQIDSMRNRLRSMRYAMNMPIAIQFSMDRDYTEPIDRIWAILGLLNDVQRQQLEEANIIDYSDVAKQKYHETYLNIMRVQIKHNKIAAMQLIAEGLSYLRNPLLPSWCPDWNSQKTGTSLSRIPGAAAGIPGGHVPSHVRGEAPVKLVKSVMKLNEDLSLDVLGLPLDTVDKVSSGLGIFWDSYFAVDGEPDVDRLSQTCSWLKHCLNIVKNLSDDAAHTVKIVGAEIPATADAHWAEYVIELYGQYEQAMQSMANVLFPPHTQINPDLSSFVIWAQNRKFFRTKAGKFGLAHQEVQENDIVCALFGGYPLFILQRVQDQSSAAATHGNTCDRPYAGESFHVVGDAYVPDWKSGQEFQGTSCEAMRIFKLV